MLDVEDSVERDMCRLTPMTSFRTPPEFSNKVSFQRSPLSDTFNIAFNRYPRLLPMPLDVSSVSMLEDVVIVDINDVSPSWNTYCFNLNVNTPGPKVFFSYDYH
jgi:hypothetical protein